MSKDKYKWRLAFPASFYEDIRDCEKEAQVLQLTWAGEKQGESIRPQGDNASYILNSLSAEGLSLPAQTAASLAQALLKEVH